MQRFHPHPSSSVWHTWGTVDRKAQSLFLEAGPFRDLTAVHLPELLLTTVDQAKPRLYGRCILTQHFPSACPMWSFRGFFLLKVCSVNYPFWVPVSDLASEDPDLRPFRLYYMFLSWVLLKVQSCKASAAITTVLPPRWTKHSTFRQAWYLVCN